MPDLCEGLHLCIAPINAKSILIYDKSNIIQLPPLGQFLSHFHLLTRTSIELTTEQISPIDDRGTVFICISHHDNIINNQRISLRTW